MSKEKQIEEMAKDLAKHSFFYNGGCLMNYSNTAKLLYEAGYRKQSEGEWIEHRETRPYTEVFYICSKCGRKEFQKEPYCHCGARMKDGTKL